MSAFTRRAVLMAGGALSLVSAVAGRRVESAQAQARLQSTLPAPLRWHDASLPSPPHRADALLQADLVAQWRAELHAQLRGGGRSVTALVRWDKALVLAGLAREQGWKSRTQSLGQGVFRVDVIV